MALSRGTPDSLQRMCTVLSGVRVRESWSWDILILLSPSEKQVRELRGTGKVDSGHENNDTTRKEKSQHTNPRQRQKENAQGWHSQGLVRMDALRRCESGREMQGQPLFWEAVMGEEGLL